VSRLDNQWIVQDVSRTNPFVVREDDLFDTDVAARCRPAMSSYDFLPVREH
jgi:hypothetical protein